MADVRRKSLSTSPNTQMQRFTTQINPRATRTCNWSISDHGSSRAGVRGSRGGNPDEFVNKEFQN